VPDQPPEPLATIGARIREHRNAHGWTQEQLAEASDLHWSFVSQVERGQRNLTTRSLLKIAAGLGVDPADLVRGLKPW